MKKEYIIGGALIVGGGLYYAYTKGLLDKFIKPKTPETAKEATQADIDKISAEQEAARIAAANAAKVAAAARQASSLLNTNSYAGKVAYIQGQINVNVDGNAGSINSNTNKAFDAIYGLDKGAISTSNIDYYKKRVENKNTKVAIALAAKKVAAQKASAVNLVNDANKFLELVNRGKYIATAKQDFTAKAYVYDSLKKGYVDVNEVRKFKKGDVFSYGNFTPYPQSGRVMYNGGSPSNLKHYSMDINNFLVTL
jgi:hypothetical protein